MEQILTYRDVRYVISHEHESRRDWVIHPADGPAEGAARGSAMAAGSRGSFKAAVLAARAAIDDWIDAQRKSAA